MAVSYEWDVEFVTSDEYQDIEHHWFCDSYAQALKVSKENANFIPGCFTRIVLVRDDDDRRSWAYIDGDKLPEYAEDAYNVNWGKIPARFHSEVSRAHRA